MIIYRILSPRACCGPVATSVPSRGRRAMPSASPCSSRKNLAMFDPYKCVWLAREGVVAALIASSSLPRRWPLKGGLCRVEVSKKHKPPLSEGQRQYGQCSGRSVLDEAIGIADEDGVACLHPFSGREGRRSSESRFAKPCALQLPARQPHLHLCSNVSLWKVAADDLDAHVSNLTPQCSRDNTPLLAAQRSLHPSSTT